MPTTINGTTGVSQVQDSVVTDGKLNLTANSASIKTALNASGSAPIYACRAWVNFNGTGTVAIRASGNVSSIADNGVGNYTVNFTTAISDNNYSVASGKGYYPSSTSGSVSSGEEVYNVTATSFKWRYQTESGQSYDVAGVSAVVFR